MRSMCVSAHVFHIGEIGCEAISCMGIDIQAARWCCADCREDWQARAVRRGR